ncbi:MAG: response regulator transcription factor [Gemmatimonadota bacterium]
MSKRVLIIDSEVGLVESLRHTLELDGHSVRSEPDVQWGIIEARTFGPNLVITTLETAQTRDGRLLSQLREEHEKLPVLLLGSRSEEADRLRGFRLGIDDFLLRPASVGELHRKIETLLLDHGNHDLSAPPVAEAVISFGDVDIRPAARMIIKGGKPIVLRLKEFDLLMALISREGRVASRLELLRGVWGYRTLVATRTVDTHIGELRAKLEADPANPQHIVTVRKVGYRFQRIVADSGDEPGDYERPARQLREG